MTERSSVFLCAEGGSGRAHGARPPSAAPLNSSRGFTPLLSQSKILQCIIFHLLKVLRFGIASVTQWRAEPDLAYGLEIILRCIRYHVIFPGYADSMEIFRNFRIFMFFFCKCPDKRIVFIAVNRNPSLVNRPSCNAGFNVQGSNLSFKML